MIKKLMAIRVGIAMKGTVITRVFASAGFASAVIAGVIAFVIAGAVIAYVICPKPELNAYGDYSKAYYDTNGALIRLSLAKDDRYRLFLPLSQISPQLIEATVLYEDQDFYRHWGIDVGAIFRAFWTTYITHERRVGASTITMQLARLKWQIRSTSLNGKIVQMLRAIQLSRHYSKDEILEAYLNLTPYGGNVEGVGAASMIYFNKQPSELNLVEALSLSVIPQNPNKRNPSTAKGQKNLVNARENLFNRWLEHHPEDVDKGNYLSLPLAVRSPAQLPFKAPHFINYVDSKISKWQQGNIHTTLNLKKQQVVENVLAAYIKSNQKKGFYNASALLLNHETMGIEAMVGSSDFYDNSIFGQVNGTAAKRSPGSTLKPFVYALGIDQGIIHPLSLMKDSPKKFGGFTPENYDKQFLGPVSAKDALILSRNVPAVNLQAKLSGSSFYQFLLDAGVSHLKDEKHYGLALALGGGEVTAIELASLYATLANGGEFQSVRSLAGQAATAAQSKKDKKRLLSPEASYMVLDILKDNPDPEALTIGFTHPDKNDIPWKTGTSWAFRDAWAAGISGPYVLIVWVGNFDGSGNNAFIGSSAAGPLFFRIMHSIFPAQDWKIEALANPIALNLKKLTLCSKTGDIYDGKCPEKEESWFIPGVSPIKHSNIYRKIPINPITQKRACYHQPGVTVLKIFEFWPSDFLQIFNQAGLSLQTPPAYEKNCNMDITSAFGASPIITSPQSSVDYVYRFGNKHSLSIPLTATVDANITRLHWFINSSYIASSGPNEIITWQATPGTFDVKVVDDDGRSTNKTFNVVSIQ